MCNVYIVACMHSTTVQLVSYARSMGYALLTTSVAAAPLVNISITPQSSFVHAATCGVGDHHWERTAGLDAGTVRIGHATDYHVTQQDSRKSYSIGARTAFQNLLCVLPFLQDSRLTTISMIVVKFIFFAWEVYGPTLSQLIQWMANTFNVYS